MSIEKAITINCSLQPAGNLIKYKRKHIKTGQQWIMLYFESQRFCSVIWNEL